MPTPTPNFSMIIIQYIPGRALYNMMCLSNDFQDVKLVLNDHTNWSIELFRSCFTIHLTNGSNFFMLSTLVFLAMAESIHIHYGRLSPAELKECAESMGYATFAILFAILDIGFIVVRVTGLVALSGNPGLATSLVIASMLSSTILSLLANLAKLIKREKCTSGGEDGLESGIVDDEAKH